MSSLHTEQTDARAHTHTHVAAEASIIWFGAQLPSWRIGMTALHSARGDAAQDDGRLASPPRGESAVCRDDVVHKEWVA